MAVYTQLASSELDGYLAGYDLGHLVALVPIQEGVENSNWRLETAQGRFILTVYEKRVDPGDLPFFLGLMQHLAERGLPCPLPVRAHDGAILRELAGKPASIVSFLEGRSARRIDPRRCAALGGAMASLHLAGASFDGGRANALALPGWRELEVACRERADSVEPGLAGEIAAELDWLGTRWPTSLPAGIIHADLFPDNVLFARERVSGLIDFYFACSDLYAYDVAIGLNAWCFEADHAFNVTKARQLLQGYGDRRPLSDDEVAALPVLLRGSALRFLMTRLYDWLHRVEGALVKPKDPLEYLRKLRFHRTLRGPEALGAG